MLIGSNEMLIHTNLLFLMADVMETLMLDVQEMLRKDNKVLRHEAKRDFNTVIGTLRKLKGSIRGCGVETQVHYGNDSDMVYEFIKLLIDRCGEDDGKLLQLYRMVEKEPSACGMKMLDGSVFGWLDSCENK